MARRIDTTSQPFLRNSTGVCPMSYVEALDHVVQTVISPAARDTDQLARFPRAALDSLGQAGLLGLLSPAETGGMGLGLADAAQVVERIARECPSTAMVVTMHYTAAVLIEKYGPPDVRRAIAEGRHLTTLAWSETGTRSHFWAPVGTAQPDDHGFVLNGSKTMVTSAQEADSYVWSSRPRLRPKAQARSGWSTAACPGSIARNPSTASDCAATRPRRSARTTCALRPAPCSARMAEASTS
jgi:alkylation response protein AidB-like acyl-CoA dehydrogenase